MWLNKLLRSLFFPTLQKKQLWILQSYHMVFIDACPDGTQRFLKCNFFYCEPVKFDFSLHPTADKDLVTWLKASRTANGVDCILEKRCSCDLSFKAILSMLLVKTHFLSCKEENASWYEWIEIIDLLSAIKITNYSTVRCQMFCFLLLKCEYFLVFFLFYNRKLNTKSN